MFITGSVSDFMSRLHQLPTGTSDLDSFVTEGRGYIASGLAAPGMSGQWEQEARRWRWLLSQPPDPTQMLTHQF